MSLLLTSQLLGFSIQTIFSMLSLSVLFQTILEVSLLLKLLRAEHELLLLHHESELLLPAGAYLRTRFLLDDPLLFLIHCFYNGSRLRPLSEVLLLMLQDVLVAVVAAFKF